MENDILQSNNKTATINLNRPPDQEEDHDLVDNVDDNGTIARAKIHYSAQSVLKIPEEYDATSNLHF